MDPLLLPPVRDPTPMGSTLQSAAILVECDAPYVVAILGSRGTTAMRIRRVYALPLGERTPMKGSTYAASAPFQHNLSKSEAETGGGHRPADDPGVADIAEMIGGLRVCAQMNTTSHSTWTRSQSDDSQRPRKLRARPCVR